MYNIDFLPQLERFRRDLFGDMPRSPSLPYEGVRGLAHAPGRGHGHVDSLRYVPPPSVKMIECHEDMNGEWVPNPVHSPDAQLSQRETGGEFGDGSKK